MLKPPRRIAVIGSTGSIGRQALRIIAAGAGLRACALAAGRNWQLLAEQAGQFHPEAVALADAAGAGQLEAAARQGHFGLPGGTALLSGPEAAAELIRRTRPDVVLTALVGAAGLAPTLAAIECKADLAIANKESLVMAGALVMPAARQAGINVLPVDSEHSAVFQCLQGQRRGDVRRVILTASGGPFRTWPAEKIQTATLPEVLNHPTWQMGQKVTIDSATLMNKALEIIEAHWLFGLSDQQIEVLIHPESLVHALVEFADGSVLAQLGAPSMVTPISFALHYPERSGQALAQLDLKALSSLHFAPPDGRRYPALELGRQVIRRGGLAGAALNAANESAVAAFVAGRINFGQIVQIVAEVLDRTPAAADEITLDGILAADAQARRLADQFIRLGRTSLRR